MDEYRQLTDRRDPTSAVAEILSESTDLNALFVAIVGEKQGAQAGDLVSSGQTEAAPSDHREREDDHEYSNEWRSGIGSMAAAVLPSHPNELERETVIEGPASSEAPQPSHNEPASTKTSVQSSNPLTVDAYWADFPTESPRETMSIEEHDRAGGGAIPESVLDLSALRDRLQRPHPPARTARTREDAPDVTTDHSTMRIKREAIHGTKPATTGIGHPTLLQFESADAFHDLPRQAESFAADGGTSTARSRRVALSLLAAGVVVSSVIITVRAIPREAKIAEPPAVVAQGAADTRLPPPLPVPAATAPPAEAAPETRAADLPRPRASTTNSRRNDGRATQAPSKDVRRSNETAAASRLSAPPIDGAAHSTDPSLEAARTPASETTLAPARESESSRSDVSALPTTPTTGAAGSTVDPAPPPPATAPKGSPAERLAVAAAPEPAKSAAAPVSRTAPRLLQGGTPEYPQILRSRRIGGIVDVQVTIDQTGRVTNATAVSGPGPLRDVAARAVRGWRYQPATVNGVPTASTTTVSFQFGEK